MRLEKNLVKSKIIKKLINFSIVFTIIFSSLMFFYIDTTRAETIIKIENPVINSVIYDKTPTIKISYNDIIGINLSNIIFILDNKDITSNATVTSEGIIFNPTKELAVGSHAVSLIVSGSLNDTITESGLFTIAESMSSTEEDIGEINPEESKEIIINEETTNQIGIDRIIINSSKNLEKTNIHIAKISITSDDITKPTISDTTIIYTGAGYININTQTLGIYSYLDIEFTSNGSIIDETDINSITINLKIEKSWIESNNVDKNSIKLLRYVDWGWEELTTTYNNEDDTYVYYDAMTKGFSIFALIGSEQLAEKQSEGINILLIIGVIIAIIIIIIALLFKLGYLYIEPK